MYVVVTIGAVFVHPRRTIESATLTMVRKIIAWRGDPVCWLKWLRYRGRNPSLAAVATTIAAQLSHAINPEMQAIDKRRSEAMAAVGIPPASASIFEGDAPAASSDECAMSTGACS